MLVATGLGISISPETIEHIVVAGTAMAGLIGIFTEDERWP